ncbi:hypothetical protein Bpfe_019874 [Biomphalaria pfeifferi]|uniref:DUF4706 domain-containing protein n=1 Tax=Biomphalaria pfeifferi TaxID=112525 RepID=A0AAD8F480_BIOPF|nr:hypothetical protein Bpfe_019874 [Biomphalaria pfeifferi]
MAVVESESDGTAFLEKNESDRLDYFMRCGYLNKQLVTEEKYFIKYMGNRWKDLSQHQKDALLDLLNVDDKTRNFYKNDFLNKTYGSKSDEDNVQSSFPRLFVNSGQKINVDFENDLWTWRDEHSGPFSWMSRSQQDLTLADLDEENISKPQPRLPKIDVEAETQKKAPLQYSHAGDSWSVDVISNYKKKEPQIRITPKHSYPEKIKNKHFLEEVNPAFNESCENLPKTSQPESTNGKPFIVSGHKNGINDKDQHLTSKEVGNKGSLIKSSLAGDILPNKDNVETTDSKRGFSNAVMESEWSTFVGAKSLPLAPEPMVMDRSESVKLTDSPYQGDDVCLIQSSPSSSQQATVISPVHSEWSEESTPDHTTYLLKGMQSPQHHRKTHPIAEFKNTKETNDLPDLDADEVLKVELKGDTIIVTTDNPNNPETDIPTTGFDFLDNW